MTRKLIRQYTQNLRTTRDSKIGKVPPEPITERMAKTAKKARTGKEVKAVIKTHDKQPIFKRKAIAGLAIKAKDMFKNRKTYDVKFMLFSVENRSGVKRPAFTMDGREYYPLIINTRGENKRKDGSNCTRQSKSVYRNSSK